MSYLLLDALRVWRRFASGIGVLAAHSTFGGFVGGEAYFDDFER